MSELLRDANGRLCLKSQGLNQTCRESHARLPLTTANALLCTHFLNCDGHEPKTKVSSQGHQGTSFYQPGETIPIFSERSGHNRHTRYRRVHHDHGTKHLLAASLASKNAYNAHWCPPESAVARDARSVRPRVKFDWPKTTGRACSRDWQEAKLSVDGWYLTEDASASVGGACYI